MESAPAEDLTVDYSDMRGGPPQEITVEGKRALVLASSMIFRSLNGLVFNHHARYQFGLSEDQDRGWVIDRIKQTVAAAAHRQMPAAADCSAAIFR